MKKTLLSVTGMLGLGMLLAVSAGAQDYGTLAKEYDSAGQPDFSIESLRAGRCFSNEDAEARGVYLVAYPKEGKTHLIVFGRLLEDGRFASNQGDNLDEPEGFEYDVGEIQGAMVEVLSAGLLGEFEARWDGSSMVVRSPHLDTFKYRQTANGKLVLRVEREESAVEHCEFGNILL